MDTTATLDQAAVTEQMWREVMRQLRSFVGRRIADPHRAEDLVGEILLKAHAHAHSIDDQERFPNWVLRVARNAVIDEYRRAGRSRERLEAAPADPPAEDPSLADSPEVLTELATCLHPLLDALAPEQRRAVQLIDLDGWPQARAARHEGVSLSGMKSRVQRGRRRLADLLGQCCTLSFDARGVPMEYTAPPGCGCQPATQ